MSEHTPGHLEIAVQVFDNDGCPETVIQGMGGAASVAVTLDFGPNNPGIREANARRLVACWNACDGLDTDQIESMVNVPEFFFGHMDILRERDSLRAVNAELLEACNLLIAYDNDDATDGVAMMNAYNVAIKAARAAIASASKQGEQG